MPCRSWVQIRCPNGGVQGEGQKSSVHPGAGELRLDRGDCAHSGSVNTPSGWRTAATSAWVASSR